VKQILDTSTRVAYVAASLVLLFNACGSQDDPGPPLALADLPHAVANALCNNIGPCCAQAGFPHDPAQCEIESEKALEASVSAMRRKEFAYDGFAARGCVEAYAIAGRTCGDASQVQRACRRVFTGALELGQPCADSNECTPGNYCQRTGGAANGECVSETLSRGKLGDRCGESCIHYDEQEFTSCNGLTTSVSTQCYSNDGLFCNDAHVCAPLPTVDQPCTGAPVCAGDNFCDATRHTCVARRTSGSCGDANDACTADAFCNFGTHQCELRRAHGEACAGSFDECVSTDFCIQGTCRTRTIATPFSCFDPDTLHAELKPAL
jgi:hypothetical protein